MCLQDAVLALMQVRRRLNPVRVLNMSSRQELLAAQIAALQTQLAEEKAKDETKRKATERIRVAASPSPTSDALHLLPLDITYLIAHSNFRET